MPEDLEDLRLGTEPVSQSETPDVPVQPIPPGFNNAEGLSLYVSPFKHLLDITPMQTEGIGDRMIRQTDGSYVFCIVIAELSDSFIVSFPTILVKNEENQITGRLINMLPFTRLFKSGVIAISDIDANHRRLYMKYLLKILDAPWGIFTHEFIMSIKKLASKTATQAQEDSQIEKQEEVSSRNDDNDDNSFNSFLPANLTLH
jgi:hypothetical protein